MIEYKKAEQSDIEQLKNLWQECFGDKMDYINLYFDNMYKNDYCYIAKEDDVVASMMMFLPATMVSFNKSINGRYVYAVATKPEFRGKGIMRQLEKYATDDVKNMGIEFLTLVPASESLFNLYREIGYKTYAYLENQSYTDKEFKQYTKETNITQIPLNELDNLRAEFLKSFDQYIYINDTQYIEQELSFLGALLYKVSNEYGNGYILCFKDKDKAYVKECSLSENLLKSSLEDICKMLECKNIVLKLSQKTLKTINKTPYSMVKWLQHKENGFTENSYQNLMLD